MSYNDLDQEMEAQSFLQQEAAHKQVANSLAYQKDFEYMKQLLPSTLKRIQVEIEEECDKLEYSGSVMFDEYPDKNYIGMLVDSILLRLFPPQSEDENENGEVQGASLDTSSTTTRSYCEDDALADCEDDFDEEISIEATSIKQDAPKVGFGRGGWGHGGHGGRGGWGPNPWGHGWGPGGHGGWGPGPWGPPPPPPPRPCRGLLCPIINRPCGRGRWCSPTPFADFDQNGNPNWPRHLVENMLINEMMFRRNRFRSRKI